MNSSFSNTDSLNTIESFIKANSRKKLENSFHEAQSIQNYCDLLTQNQMKMLSNLNYSNNNNAHDVANMSWSSGSSKSSKNSVANKSNKSGSKTSGSKKTRKA